MISISGNVVCWLLALLGPYETLQRRSGDAEYRVHFLECDQDSGQEKGPIREVWITTAPTINIINILFQVNLLLI